MNNEQKLIGISFEAEGVVVDAGDFPTAPLPLRLVDSVAKVVCCDGAAVEFIRSRRTPWRIVGDGDSLPADFKEKYADILRHFPDQETNDQTKAVRYLAERGVKRIAIVGATGRREDHTLGNISLLIDYMKQGLEARIYTDYGVFIPVTGPTDFECEAGAQVSIFNFGATAMTSVGLRWPIRDFDNWWQGTLNEAIGTEFKIEASGSYLVFITYLPKW